MKYVLELILSTVIIFFVWNMLRRIFLTPHQGNQTRMRSNPTSNSTKSSSSASKKGLNWDAEDAEFEEVKDEEKLKR